MHCPSFRISFRRRNHPPGGSYWDPFWANSLLNAAKHRGHQPISVNDGMFFDSAEECDAVKSLAEEMWREMREQHQREVEHISANHMVLRAQHQPKSNQATDLWQLPTLALTQSRQLMNSCHTLIECLRPKLVTKWLGSGGARRKRRSIRMPLLFPS